MMSKHVLSEEEKKKFSVGSLTYTKASLFVLFSWLLWGDFCFQIMEHVGGLGIIGLYMMEKLDANMFTVGFLTSTIPMLLGVFLGPIISFKSDRYRSKYGRRIPFMLLTAPFLCVFLVCLGFSDEIYTFLGDLQILKKLGITHYSATIVVVGFLIGGFAFFNEFVNTVWWYLFADVVPPHFMGRFQGLFRVVNSVAGFFFSAVVVQYQLTYMRWVFIGAALLYFVGFSLMCWRVKEGEYPPVTDVGHETTLWDKISLYFRECFTHPIYIGMYCSTFFTSIAVSAGIGSSYFLLHISQHLKEFGASKEKIVSVAAAGADSGISLGKDGKMKKWDLKSGKEAPFAPEHMSLQVEAMPGGKEIVSLSKKGLHLLDSASAREIVSFPMEGSEPLKFALSSNGKWIAILRLDKSVEILSVSVGKDGQSSLNLAGKIANPELSEQGTALSISSDGSKIAVSCADFVLVKELREGKVNLLAELRNSEKEVLPMKNMKAMLFVPSITDPQDQKEKDSSQTEKASAAFSKIMVNITGFFKDMATNDTIYRHLPSPACAIVQDAWLACGGEDAKLHIWDIAAATKVMAMKGHKKEINCLSYRSDLNLLFSGGSDKMIYVWNLSHFDPKANDNSIRSYAGYSTEISSISTPADSSKCISGSFTGKMHLWNLEGGVTLKQMGILRCLTLILGLIIAYPFGSLVDRFHPLRIVLLTTAIIVPLQLSCFFFIVDYWTFLAMEILKTTAFGLLVAGGYPMFISIFPRDKFGQFCSANGLANQFTRMLAGLLIGGMFMDLITDKRLLSDNLRYVYAVCAFGYMGSTICLLFVYKRWKMLGGDKGYVPPLSGGSGEKAEPAPAS